jgi:hypothetical protein
LVVGDAEHDRQHAFLHFVQAEHAAEQERAHVRHRGAHRHSALAVDIPEGDRAGAVLRRNLQALQPLLDLGVAATGLGEPREVALHVGHEHRHADRGEGLREGLQRDGLAGAGRAGDQAVAVRHPWQQTELGLAALCHEQRREHG